MCAQVLHSNGYSHPMGSPEWLRQPAFIQSFEVSGRSGLYQVWAVFQGASAQTCNSAHGHALLYFLMFRCHERQCRDAQLGVIDLFGAFYTPLVPNDLAVLQVGNLQWLASHTQLPLIQLLDPAEKIVPDTQQTYGSLMSEQGLAGISQYAAGIGPHKRDIIGAVHPGMGQL